MYETDRWAARVFAYLFNQIALMPEGAGKQHVAKLLLEAPAKVQELAVDYLVKEKP